MDDVGNSCDFVFDHTCDLAVADHHFGFPEGCFNWFLGLEDFRYFFQRPPLRLDEEEVYDDNLEHVPKDEEEVISPANSGEGNLRNECVVKERNIDKELSSCV